MNEDQELEQVTIDLHTALANLRVTQEVLERRLRRAEIEREIGRDHIRRQTDRVNTRVVRGRRDPPQVRQDNQPQVPTTSTRQRRPLAIGDYVKVIHTHPTRAGTRGAIIGFTQSQVHVRQSDGEGETFRIWRNNLRRIRRQSS